ncbi:MAG TPA: aminoacetone oxidase family FAD-binding enzyme [Sulfurovum sp. UBA12169]|nr:MAG TPA: aminoacetone oxidase family FAD-binding enzyme [Sulfurovum sp. UBA12169]
MMDKELIIIGGGASALMLASVLPRQSALLIEANGKAGAKMLVSGGGKCNITNQRMDSAFYAGRDSFIKQSLRAFDQKALLAWIKQRGIDPVVKKEGQYFCPNSAKELLEIFNKESKKQTILLDEKVLKVSKRGDYFSVKTDKRVLTSKIVVVASGGLSYPILGASSIGYEIAASFGHTIVKTAPALVGFTVQKEQFFFKELSGTSVEVEIKVADQLCRGPLLFAHKGISGPAILDASLYWEKGNITIDFLPGFSWSTVRSSKKQLTSIFPFPKRVAKAFLIQLGIEDKMGSKLSLDELKRLETLSHYSFAPAGTFGYSKAEVTRGGVCTDEVDANTMMSLKSDGLYFIGEVLDVTGRLGGYNFQWAFSSAYNCAKSLKIKR